VLVIRDGGDLKGAPLGESVQLVFAHAVDAEIATDPEVAAAVFDDSEDAVVE
jgi:hypothetical protein